MLKMLLLLLSVLVFIFVYFFCAKITVKRKQYEAESAFKNVDKELRGRYNLILEIINKTQNEQELAGKISGLRNEVIMLGVKKEFIDRRIALDMDLASKAEMYISGLENSSDDEVVSLVNEYKNNNEHVLKAMKVYNSKAEALKHAVNVFPWSFVSRLNRVKALDVFRI